MHLSLIRSILSVIVLGTGLVSSQRALPPELANEVEAVKNLWDNLAYAKVAWCNWCGDWCTSGQKPPFQRPSPPAQPEIPTPFVAFTAWDLSRGFPAGARRPAPECSVICSIMLEEILRRFLQRWVELSSENARAGSYGHKYSNLADQPQLYESFGDQLVDDLLQDGQCEDYGPAGPREPFPFRPYSINAHGGKNTTPTFAPAPKQSQERNSIVPGPKRTARRIQRKKPNQRKTQSRTPVALSEGGDSATAERGTSTGTDKLEVGNTDIHLLDGVASKHNAISSPRAGIIAQEPELDMGAARTPSLDPRALALCRRLYSAPPTQFGTCESWWESYLRSASERTKAAAGSVLGGVTSSVSAGFIKLLEQTLVKGGTMFPESYT